MRWNGEPVALVLAETQEEADHATTLIRVRYAEVEAVVDFAAAVAAGTKTGVFMGQPLHNAAGAAEKALAARRRRWMRPIARPGTITTRSSCTR